MDGGGTATDENTYLGVKSLIWENYVFRRGIDVHELWDQMYAVRARKNRPLRLLYITGRGFDLRANTVLEQFLDRLKASHCNVDAAKLLLVGLTGYQLSEDLRSQTAQNAERLIELFKGVGETQVLEMGRSADGEDDITTAVALRNGADKILQHVDQYTDIVLDVSSLPRISYLTILLSLLAKLVPTLKTTNPLFGRGVGLQVLVGEDPALDSKISSEDPGNDLVLIPGYAEAFQAETLQDSHLVWMPLLGENRVAQLKKIEGNIPAWAEICPVLPHPSRNPRRGDELLMEYHDLLIGARETPLPT